MTAQDVRGILPLGGTILGTSRTNPLKIKDGVTTAMRTLRHSGIDALVAIGGDDTLSVAAAMHEAGFATVGVPKTIDNDLSVTDFCIGFDTAVGVVTDALVRLAKRGVGDLLASSVEHETGFETRVTVLGHLQRGGSPSPSDRIWATRLGACAADLIMAGKSGVIPIRRDGGVQVVALSDVIA